LHDVIRGDGQWPRFCTLQMIGVRGNFMKTISTIPLLYATLILCSCSNPATTDSKIKELKDSLSKSRQIIDSLANTDATLFDKALKLEKDSADRAVSIYQLIAGRDIDNTITYYPTQAKNRIHYLESLKFLNFLKSDNVENIDVMTFHRNFKISNIDSFLTFIPKRRFEIYDANKPGNKNTKYSMDELRKQLTERKGQAFETIAQLSYIYSMPYPQYSQTDFAISTDDMTGIYIRLGGNYRLSFQFDEKDMPYKLAKIESYHIDDL